MTSWPRSAASPTGIPRPARSIRTPDRERLTDPDELPVPLPHGRVRPHPRRTRGTRVCRSRRTEGVRTAAPSVTGAPRRSPASASSTSTGSWPRSSGPPIEGSTRSTSPMPTSGSWRATSRSPSGSPAIRARHRLPPTGQLLPGEEHHPAPDQDHGRSCIDAGHRPDGVHLAAEQRSRDARGAGPLEHLAPSTTSRSPPTTAGGACSLTGDLLLGAAGPDLRLLPP